MQRMLLHLLLAIGLVGMGATVPSPAEAAKSNTYFDLGVFAFEQGNYREALDYLEQALKIEPHSTEIYHYLGVAYLKLEMTGEAARYLEVVQEREPERVGLSYDMAMLRMQQGRYPAALEYFEKVIGTEPNHVPALFNSGICLYELNRCAEAIDYLSRAADLSPAIRTNAAFYIGICQYRLGNPEEAVENFETVRRFSANDSLRRSAEQWLAAIEREALAAKRYRLYAKAGFRYDDNVVLEPLDEEIFSDESDLAAVGYLSGRYHLINRPGFKMGTGYSHYQTAHQDLSDYDVTGSIGRLYAEYAFFPFSIGVSWLPSYYWIDSESYLLRHEFSPEATWQISDKTLASVSYSYMINNYFEDGGRDGHANTADFDMLHLIGSGYLTWGLGVEVNSARRDDEDYDEFEARVGAAWPLIEKLRLSATAIYNDKDYDAPDAVINITRKDKRYYLILSVSRPVFRDWLSLIVDYEYTRNNSTIDLFEYQRNAVTLSVAASL